MRWGKYPRLVLSVLIGFVPSFIFIPTSQAAACSPTTTTYSSYTVLSFTTTGTCTWTAPADISTADILLIGGGGGGGGGAFGGGGGAGGFVEKLNHSFTTGTTYTIVVGDGGAGGAATLTNADYPGGNFGIDGSDTSIDSITAKGGGGGAGFLGAGGSRANAAGRPGGSGGGASEGGGNSSGGATTQSSYTGATTYGNAGGSSVRADSKSGGGGGGAGSAGSASEVLGTYQGGVGGSGANSSLRTGSAVTYAAGGDGGSNAVNINRTNEAANTGNGGDGANWNNVAAKVGGNGGSGILIIRYIPYSGSTSSAEPQIWLGKYSIDCPIANPGEKERIKYANKIKPVIAPAENLVGSQISQTTLDEIYKYGIYFDNKATKVKTATIELPNYGCQDKLITIKKNNAIQFIAGGFNLQSEARGYLRTNDGKWFDLTGVTLHTNTAAFLHTIQFKKPGQYLVVLAEQPNVDLGKMPTYGYKNARFVVEVPKTSKKNNSIKAKTSSIEIEAKPQTFKTVALVSPLNTAQNQISIYLLLPLLLIFAFMFRRFNFAQVKEDLTFSDPAINNLIEKIYFEVKKSF